MLNIFRKKKPKLSDIIPDGFVDIHSHVLPAIDDGPSNLEQSLTLLTEIKKLDFQKLLQLPIHTLVCITTQMSQ